MIRAQQALHQILLIGIDEEPQEILVLKARTIIEKFKADISASHRGDSCADDKRFHIASEVTKLRDAVDLEIDRRVDEDLVDSVCDLLEHLSCYLHADIGDRELTKVDATVVGSTTSAGVEPPHI